MTTITNDNINGACPYRACRMVEEDDPLGGDQRYLVVAICAACRVAGDAAHQRRERNRVLLRDLWECAAWSESDPGEAADEARDAAFGRALSAMEVADRSRVAHSDKRAWMRRRWRIELVRLSDGGWVTARAWRGRECIAETERQYASESDAVQQLLEDVRYARRQRRAA